MSNHSHWLELELIRAFPRHPGGAAAALIAASFTPLAWLSCETARRFLLAVAILSIGLPIGVHVNYRQEMSDFGALGGFTVTLTTLALVGLYLPRLVPGRDITSVGGMQLPRSSAPLALYLLFSVLSLLAASDMMLALYEVFLILQLLLLHSYIVTSVKSREDILLIIRYLLIGLIAQGLLMIALGGGLAEVGLPGTETRMDYQNPGGVTRQINILGLKGRIDESATGQSRVAGSMGSSNDAANYLTGAIGIALGVLFASLQHRYRVLAAFAVGVGALALVLTFSRGGWIAFMFALAIIGYFAPQVRRSAWKLLVVLAIGLILLISTFFSDDVRARLTEDDHGAAGSRVPLMKLAALIIEDHPLIGVGANNFPLAMQEYLTRGFSGEFVYSVHNKYLLVLSETGPGGFLAFVWFLVATIRQGMRSWHYGDPLISPLALGCVAAVAGEMLHMFVDIFRGPSVLQLLCVISALLAVLQRLAAGQRPAIPCRWGGHVTNSARGRPVWISAPL